MSPDPIPIRYACVTKGPTVLAEFIGDDYGDGDGAGDLRPLAARCLEAAPRFHCLYTHTAGGRIYAFLTEDHLAFFAIADETLGRPQVLHFLRRVRDAPFASSAVRSRRIDGPAPLSPLCFQGEFLPALRRLVLPLPSHEDKPPPPSPPSDAPLTAGTPSDPEGSKRGRHKKDKTAKKKKRNADDGGRIEISVAADHADDADSGVGTRGPKSPQKPWRRHVRMVLLIDLVVCILFVAIWLSGCRGFHCIHS